MTNPTKTRRQGVGCAAHLSADVAAMVAVNGLLIGHAGFPAGLCLLQDLALVCNRPEGETSRGENWPC